jgi:hypothetical protein
MDNARLAGAQTTWCIGDAGQTEATILTSVESRKLGVKASKNCGEPSKRGHFSIKDMQI